MANIFVSYSRKDIVIARHLVEKLQKHEMDVWVDLEDIPPTVEWMKEIQKNIEEASNFLCIISPNSIASKVCKEELEIAVKNGKRLIPVVIQEIKWDDAPPELSKLNYLFFRETDDFGAALDTLLTAIKTDYEWVETHGRIQVKALEWERGDKDNAFLLRGKDLEEAERLFSINAAKVPSPTDIQREYLLKSRQATDRQKRVTTSVLVFIILMLSGISAYFAIPRIQEAIAKTKARGEMVPIPEGPSVFGTDNPNYIEIGFPSRQPIDSLPAFQIGKYEVSNYQYGQCVKYGPCTVPVNQTNFYDPDKPNNLVVPEKQDHPVVYVTLFQANTYCQWLGQRLPNQFEWERAARGPGLKDWPWGDREPTPNTANMPWGDYKPSELQSVDSNPDGKSPEGIYNLVGNASEWTASFIEKGKPIVYDPIEQVWNGDPKNYNGTRTYVQRGGGWGQNVDEVGTFITGQGTTARIDLGFRCAAYGG